MGSFLKPGQRKTAAFGISFDADRDAASIPAVIDSEKQSGLLHQRNRLPVTRYQREILYLLEKHSCTVLVGETGCGKTTQVPQMLLEAGWAAGETSRGFGQHVKGSCRLLHAWDEHHHHCIQVIH